MEALLEYVGADVKRMFGDRLPNLRDFLSEQVPQELLIQATQSWERCGHGDQIAMGDMAPVRGVLSLLSTSKIRPNTVRIAQQQLQFDSPDIEIELHAVTKMFAEEFSLAPTIEYRSFRDERPHLYLLITTQPDKPKTSSAANANGVLKAWLVACQAFLIFQKIQMGDHQ